MAKDKDDDVEKWLKENLPQYEETVKALPDMEVTVDEKKTPIPISPEDRLTYGAIGAGVGAAASKGMANRLVAQRLAQGKPVPPSLFSAASPSARAVRAAPTAPAPAPMAPPMGAPTVPGRSVTDQILQGTIEDGATGRARTTGFNVQTAQEAARQRQMAELIEEMRRRGVVGQSAKDLFASLPGMTSTPSGVLTPRAEAPTTAGPRPAPAAPFMGPPEPPTTGGYTMQQRPGALQQAAGMAKRGMGAIASPVAEVGGALLSSPRISGALGGAGVAESAMQYLSRQDADPMGAKVSVGTGMLGLLSLLPQITPATRMAAGVLSPLGMYLYDKLMPYKSVLEQPPPQQ